MRHIIFFFLAFLYIARAQYVPCTSATGCSASCGRNPCVQDAAGSSGSCFCLDCTSPNFCRATCANYDCTLSTSATSSQSSCVPRCFCPDAGNTTKCGELALPSPPCSGIVCDTNVSNGACFWNCPPPATCADSGRTDKCAGLTMPASCNGQATCRTDERGQCYWACNSVGCPDERSTTRCGTAQLPAACTTGVCGTDATTGICTWSCTCPNEGSNTTCGDLIKPTDCPSPICRTVSGACSWYCPPTTGPCPDRGSTQKCGNLPMPTNCATPPVCTDNNGKCEWSTCSTSGGCADVGSTTQCGGTTPLPCNGTNVCGSVAANGVVSCSWNCECLNADGQCGGVPKPNSTAACNFASTFRCTRLSTTSGTRCYWSEICDYVDPCADKCTTEPACPSGSKPTRSGPYKCIQDTDGTCKWDIPCVPSDFSCAEVNGVCGVSTKPRECRLGLVVTPGQVFTPVCTALGSSATNANPTCDWKDNCIQICQEVNGTCNGVPKPRDCPLGFYSTAASPPTFTCQGSTSSTCSWVANGCYASCSMIWPATSLTPICGGNRFPCNNVPVTIPSALFPGITVTSDTIPTSPSLLERLCITSRTCNFPSIPCTDGTCRPQILADGSSTCGGKPQENPCPAGQEPVSYDCISATNACEWRVTCKDRITSACVKDITRRTCNGIKVVDTCESGTYFKDFDCIADANGNCSSSAICVRSDFCDANTEKCVAQNLVRPTCADFENETAAPKCCCSTAGTGRCYYNGLGCAATIPCRNCDVKDPSTLNVCPTGQILLAPSICVKDSAGNCFLTAPKCGDAPPGSSCPCTQISPCNYGTVPVSKTCDASTNCIIKYTCKPDTCTGNNPCSCNETNGCVFVKSNTAAAGGVALCVSASSTTQNLAGASVEVVRGSDACKSGQTTGIVPTTTGRGRDRDNVVDSLTTSSTTASNINLAIQKFIAALKEAERMVWSDGSFPGIDFLVSFFAVGVPSRGADGSLTLYVTVLFTPRSTTSPSIPEDKHFKVFCPSIKTLLATLSGAFDVSDLSSDCKFEASSVKRNVLQQNSGVYNAGSDVNSTTVTRVFGSSSSSITSGVVLLFAAFIALLLTSL